MLLPFLFAIHQNLLLNPVTEDTTYFGGRSWKKNQVGTKQESSSAHQDNESYELESSTVLPSYVSLEIQW